MEVCTLLGQTIDVGCFQIRMSMATEIPPTPVIREDENYIGTILGEDRQA
jgi:hypothetical protein